MKTNAAIARARVILNDNTGRPRFRTSELETYINEGVLALKNLAPHLFVGKWDFDGGLVGDDEIPIANQYCAAVVDYIVARAELRNDESADPGRIKAMQQMIFVNLGAI